MAYRNKTYVAFDGDNDMHFYRLMMAWKANDNHDFNFYNAHDLNTARDSSQEESIKAQLSERMRNSVLFLLLIGEKTKFLTKFVKWEIEQAIRRDLPIVGVNLNGSIGYDESTCPPALRGQLSIHVPFKQLIIQYAIDNWPNEHSVHRKGGDTGAYRYKDSVYASIGL